MKKLATANWLGGALLFVVSVSPAAQALGETAQPRAAAPDDWRTAVSRVARETIPAVVHIEVISRKGVSGRAPEEPGDRSPGSLFGAAEPPRQFKQERRGLGSGMIFDTDGHVLTNAHVVAGAVAIEVVLANGEPCEATLVGADPKTDLAVLKIPARTALPKVSFGDSDSLEVGEWVVAIGHPRGLDHTVTQGIISAKHRRGITDPTSYGDFLQTDAAINPGNSGGPLLNLAGQVIGVNTRIASASGGSEGIGFAIPSNMAAHIAKQLIARGKVERGWLGVSTQPLTYDIARKLGRNDTDGAFLVGVTEGGPAAKAGLKGGQIVLACDGESVRNDLELRNKIVDVLPGKTVTFRVIDGEGTRELPVVIGDLDTVTKGRIAAAEARFGITVREITPEESELYKLRPGSGVVVAAAEPKGVLAAQGLQVGDVLLELRGRRIDGPELFGWVATSLPAGEEVPVLAVDHRTGEPGYLQTAVP